MQNGGETWARMCADMESRTGADRTSAIRQWADELEVSASTIYRHLGAARNGHRGVRSDRGRRRNISEEVYQWMVAMTVRWGWTSEEVVRQAEYEGRIDRGAIHPATYAKYLAQDGIPRLSLTDPGKYRGPLRNRQKDIPYRSFEMSHSNIMHQIDATEIPRYFLHPDRPDIGFEPDMGPNRGGSGHQRVHLIVVIDDHSRICHARLFRSKGTRSWITACVEAWSTAEGTLFQGRPEKLYGDQDGVTKATAFRRFTEDMDVEYIPHEPGNSPATGKVERAIGYFKPAIQRRLRPYIDRGEKLTLDDANEVLAQIVAEKNARTHSETSVPPNDRFLSGLSGPVRGVPIDIDIEAYFLIEREVLLRGNLTLQIDRVRYQVPQCEPYLSHHNRKVPVKFHRDQERRTHLQIWIQGEWRTIEARQAAPDRDGKIRSLPTSRAEHLIRAAYEVDLSDMDLGLAAAAEPTGNATPIIPVEPFGGDTPSSPITTITRKSAMLLLAKNAIFYTDEDIDTLFGGRTEIPEPEFHTAVTHLRAAAKHRRSV